MSDRFQFFLNIDNRTSSHVKYVRADFSDGHARGDPAADILPQRSVTNAFVATGTSWTPFGTEGTAFFQIGTDTRATFSVYWLISSKPNSDNEVTLKHEDGVKVRLDGFHGGSDEIVNCTVVVTEG